MVHDVSAMKPWASEDQRRHPLVRLRQRQQGLSVRLRHFGELSQRLFAVPPRFHDITQFFRAISRQVERALAKLQLVAAVRLNGFSVQRPRTAVVPEYLLRLRLLA